MVTRPYNMHYIEIKAMTMTARLSRFLIIALTLSALTGCPQNAAVIEQQRQAGIAFLAANAKQPGVTTTASGLQYQVLKAGQGATPKATDTVTVNYRGTLTDGKAFDSGEGISFPLDRVIPGWTEGLQLMQEGAQYRFFIPAELAYGEAGAGRAIPPHAALIFEVDLIKVGQP